MFLLCKILIRSSTTMIQLYRYLKAVVIGSIQVFIFLLIIKEVNMNVMISSCLTGVKRVTSCPTTKEQWFASAIRKNCSGIYPKCNPLDQMKYHCLINSWKNVTFELCSHDVEIVGYSCAEFNKREKLIQSTFKRECISFPLPCPFIYNSSLGYLYPQCFEQIDVIKDGIEVQGGERPLPKDPISSPDNAVTTKAIVFILIVFGVFFGVFLCVYVNMKFKPCDDSTDVVEEDLEMNLLSNEHQKYDKLKTVKEECLESSDEEDFYKETMQILERFKNAYSVFTLKRLYIGRNHIGKGVIVVVVNENENDLPESFDGYEVICKLWGDNPLESRLAAYSIQAKENPLSLTQSNTLESIILRYNQNLMVSHSNLEMISISPVQSRKNGTEIIVCPCIVLYCTHKGVIPIGERGFPEKLDGVRIDVREGFFYPCPNEGDEFFQSSKVRHEHIRMGCNIGREGAISTGTLGGFVDIGNGDIGFITCAHVLHPSLPISNTDATAQFNVVQPGYGINKENHICGIHLRSVCPGTTEHFPDNITVDASLVKVFPDRKPERGLYAGLSMEDVISMGFTGDFPPEFQSGKIRDLQDPTARQFRHNACFKIGAASGLTKGLLSCSATSYRHTSQTLTDQRNTCIFHKQLEINPICGQSFAIRGDSGAFVYQVETDPQPENEKMVCIGVLTGVNSVGQALVTPIKEVLKRLGIQDITKVYSFPNESMEIL